MKKLYVIVLSCFLSLFLISCSQELVNPEPEGNGSITLTVDKSGLPANTAALQILLSRSGFSNIERTISLSETNSIEINDIAEGKWTLKINALHANKKVLSGSKSLVDISGSKVLQINNIKWALNLWEDYNGNPVFHASQSPFNPPYGVHSGKVIYDDNKYKMWYTNVFNSAATNVGYAESSDGIAWQSASNQAVLTPGVVGQWDSWSAQAGPVIKVGGTYRMYYTGYCDQYSNWNIGIAISNDGINWEKIPNPVLRGDSAEFQIHAEDIVQCDGKYYLYYTIRNPLHDPFYSIGMAISDDGLTWTKYSGNPILVADTPWENGGVYYPTVIADGDVFRMAYMNGGAPYAFGMATSTDGKNFVKDAENPFFKTSDVANNWASEIAYPYMRKFNGQYYIYYAGMVSGVYHIGLVIK